jgi:hypothetical protein
MNLLSRHQHGHASGEFFTLHWMLHLLGSFVVSVLSARWVPIALVFSQLCLRNRVAPKSRFLQLRSFADYSSSTRQSSRYYLLHKCAFSSSLAWLCPFGNLSVDMNILEASDGGSSLSSTLKAHDTNSSNDEGL